MAEDKDDLTKGKASWQAQVAFYLSLTTAAFSAFQWWSAEREAKIKSSIDVGQKFIESGVLTSFMSEGVEFDGNNSTYDFKKMDSRFKVSVAKFTFHMDYMAFLINHNLLYDDYLPTTLKCSIKFASKIVSKAKEQGIKDIDIPEADIYANKLLLNTCDFL